MTQSSSSPGALNHLDEVAVGPARVHGVDADGQGLLPQSPSRRAAITPARAASFWSGVTLSSRSNMISSAGRLEALRSIFGALPGTDRQERRGRALAVGSVVRSAGLATGSSSVDAVGRGSSLWGSVARMDARQLEQAARGVLSAPAYDYYAGGADDEVTLADNVAAWSRYRLRPHTLRDVSQTSTATVVLGTEVSMPLLVAPMAYQRLADDEGEVATARGTAAAGTVMLVSTLATVSLEDVAAAAPAAPRWFQVYVHKDRGWTEDLVKRAEAAGYRALVLTVDLPVMGYRRRDERNRFTLPDGMDMANVGASVPHVEGSGVAAYATTQLEPNLTPADIGWLRGLCDLPVVVKGILRGDDARLAVEAGASGIIVSNHGGRQLDSALAGADALPDVAAAVGGDAEVYVDGGVRRGTDVVKALALGARAALIGRPVVWGLAVGGEAGVTGVLERMQAEIERAMALCGTPTVADIARDLVVPSATQPEAV